MKTHLLIWFEGEPRSRLADKRQMIFDDPVLLPEVGDVVHNPTAGTENEPLHGILVRRQLAYSAEELTIYLIPRDPLQQGALELPQVGVKRRRLFDFAWGSRDY